MTKLAFALKAVTSPDETLEWLDRIGGAVDCYKLQMDVFGRGGPELIRRFVDSGVEVFLDLKFHDIPSVVAMSVETAAEMGVSMLTVHTMGGPEMLAAAAGAARKARSHPRVLGVTVLTSLDRAQLAAVTGKEQSVEERALALARLAKQAGCYGVVASPHELKAIKSECGSDFAVVTPGIRLDPPGATDDQARFMTPALACRLGADYIVVGRPIHAAPDPLATIAEIRRQLENGNE
ncbi:MAG: orotidine-5'-phosphate decarboxylase [candidate division WOR-3 bacterium]|nr:MAG: orotidine-5'-phosphate decarboxylase [candidate division WOR-3 bacterium]